ncbi:MAG TPA: hypothetical protein VHC20_02410 [Candidatus Paceibacterota bacterium]|nr:hypothetical protein [Candidatus Paceibacterota bacterium]
MKKLALPLLALGVFIVPQVTFAAWWNPLTWFHSENAYEMSAEQTDSAPASTISTTSDSATAKEADANPDSKTEIASLQAEINSLNKENTSLRSQLAQAQKDANSCSVTQSQPTGSQDAEDDSQATAIRVELAKLDQIDTQLDTYTDDAVLDILNNSTKLDGKSLFGRPPRSAYSYWRAIDLSKVSTYTLHELVNDYRSELKIELAKYGG